MWSHGARVSFTVMPRSFTKLQTGRATASIENAGAPSVFTFPICRIQHFLIDTVNCHLFAQSLTHDKTDCKFIASTSEDISAYIFKSSAKNLILTRYSLKTWASSSMYITNSRGPRPLPWTIPLVSGHASDNSLSTLVTWERDERKFLIHSNRLPDMPYSWLWDDFRQARLSPWSIDTTLAHL